MKKISESNEDCSSSIFNTLPEGEIKFLDEIKERGVIPEFVEEELDIHSPWMWGCGIDLGYIENGHIKALNIRDYKSSPLQKTSNFPSSIKYLTHLEELLLGCFKNDKFPQEIVTLPNLRKITLHECEGKEFPRVFAQNPHIEFIELKRMEYESFPKELLEREKPLEIIFYLANFIELWSDIKKMDCIKNLGIIPKGFLHEEILSGLTTLPHLEKLYLCEASFDKLPDSWANFPSLVDLCLQRNTYEYYKKNKIDLEIPDMETPKDWLIEFPKVLCSIKTLKRLYVDENILDLPKEIINLPNLEVLEINSQHIDEFPEWIYDLSALKGLYLNGVKYYPEDYEMCISQSQLSYERGEYEKMLQWLDKAFSFNEEPKKIWINRTYAYLGMKDTSKALESIEKSLEIDPEDANSWDTKSDVYLESGDLTKAVESIKRSIEIDPTDTISWEKMSAIYLKMGNLTKALIAAEKALELIPEDYYYKSKVEKIQEKIDSQN
jgi:tetratricopeptide (TPR) repeat protein